jgi:hypothetical protein
MYVCMYIYKPEAQRSPLSQPPLPISSQTPPPHPRDHEALANALTQEEVACLKKKKSIYICKGTCLCVCVCVCVCVYVLGCTYIYIYICIYVYIYMYMYVCICMYVYVCMYIRMYVCIHIYNIHTHIHTHTGHTYMFTGQHIQRHGERAPIKKN